MAVAIGKHPSVDNATTAGDPGHHRPHEVGSHALLGALMIVKMVLLDASGLQVTERGGGSMASCLLGGSVQIAERCTDRRALRNETFAGCRAVLQQPYWIGCDESAGRLRPWASWLDTHSSAAMADPRDSSPHSTVAATISAKARTRSGP